MRDHPIIEKLMRDGDLGPVSEMACIDCHEDIWLKSYGGRCTDCFYDWLWRHLDDAADALGFEIIDMEAI